MESVDSERKGRDLKAAADAVLEIVEEIEGIAAAPSSLWILALYNSMGGPGFSGHVTNKAGV